MSGAEIALQGLDLGLQRPGHPGADIGLERQADPRRLCRDGLYGAFHHVHDLVPVAFDRGEHGIGPVRQAAVTYYPYRVRDVLRDGLAYPERRHREGDKHRDSPARLVMCRSDLWLQGWEPVPGEPRITAPGQPWPAAAASAVESAGIFVIRRRACADVPKACHERPAARRATLPWNSCRSPVSSASACARSSGRRGGSWEDLRAGRGPRT